MKNSAEQMIEDGVALIARGLFRLGDKTAGNDPKSAYDSGMAAVSTIREMAFEFMRKANNQ